MCWSFWPFLTTLHKMIPPSHVSNPRPLYLFCFPNIHHQLWYSVQFDNQFSSVQSLSRVRLCDPMNCSTPGLPVHQQLLEFTQTHVHQVGDAIQPSHPLSSPSPPAPNPSQHQSLFQWVNSLHEVVKVLEFHSYLFIVSLPSAQNVSSVGAGSFVCFATDLCLEPRIFHGV